MLHAPINENKTKDRLSKTQSKPESQGRDRSSGWAVYSSLGLGGEKLSDTRSGKQKAQG